MTVQCCMCKLIRVDGEWIRRPQDDRGDTSHTYCPVCLDETLTTIRMEQVSRDLTPVVA